MEAKSSKGFFRTVFSLASIAVSFIPGIGTLARMGIQVGLMGAGMLLGPKKPKGITAPESRLSNTFNPTEPRKIVFGETALATDMRYQAFTGSGQEYLNQIICVASHEVDAIRELWLDNEAVWSNGAVLGRYVGWLDVQVRTVGNSGNGIPVDGVWNGSCTLTGCAYVFLRYRIKSSNQKQESPFAGGVSGRITIRGRGAKIYDPRLDSTVPGGSGTQRAADQSTWRYDWGTGGTNAGSNPALQLLFFLIGWRVNGKLAVGMGLPVDRIDLPSFIAAANVCDEQVALAAGGTEPRYRAHGMVSEADDRTAVVEQLCAAMNGTLRDAGGKLALSILKNDLATPAASFTENDILGDERWSQTPDLDRTFNVLRGRYINPSDQALYQPVEFPEVRLASLDGIDRIETIDLPLVQSPAQAQRLAKTRLQRNQYQGLYEATFGARAWQVSVGDCVSLSHQGLGWSSKRFRVLQQTISATGQTRMQLLEENAAIYAWLAEDHAPVTPAVPTIYDPSNSPLIAGVNGAIGLTGAIGDANRVRYSLMEAGTLGYKVLFQNPAGLTGGEGAADFGGVAYYGATRNWSGTGQAFAISIDRTNPACLVPVTPNERIFVGFRQAMDGGNFPWYVVLRYLDAAGNVLAGFDPPTIASGTGNSGGQRFGGFHTVPAGARWTWFDMYVDNGSVGTGYCTLYLGQPMVASAGPEQTVWPAFSPGPSSEPGATVSGNVVPNTTSVTILANADGTIKPGQLPKTMTARLERAGATVTSGIVWECRVISGSFNGLTPTFGWTVVASTGGALSFNVNSVGASGARYELAATHLGVRRISATPIEIIIQADAQPTGGGGGGGTSSSISSFTATGTDVSYGFSDNQLPNVRTGGAGQIALTCSVNYELIGNNAGIVTMFGYFQYRTVGGTWTDAHGEVGGQAPARRGTDPDFGETSEPGSLSISFLLTGLSLSTEYEVRLRLRDDSNSRAVQPYGIAVASGG